MILDIIAAFVIGILAGLGVGSAGFLTIYLIFLRGYSSSEAQGVNLWFFVFALTAACLVHVGKRKPDFKLLLLMMIPGIVGAVCGALLLPYVPEKGVRVGFGIFLIVSGIYTLVKKDSRPKKQTASAQKNIKAQNI